MNNPLKISIIGTGNAGFRLALALKSAGFEIPFVINRSIEAALLLASILNKPENNLYTLPQTIASDNPSNADGSDVIIIAVSDDAIPEILSLINKINSVVIGDTTVCHISGGTHLSILSHLPSFGVFYPLMTLSKNKPVDFTLVPFLLEYSDEKSGDKLEFICKALGSEFTVTDSEQRLKMHIAAVFVSDFINYLASLSYDISVPNHVYLLPIALETVRKAFLYGDPAVVQRGPAKRGDICTVEKHLEVLKGSDEHFEVYKKLSDLIIKQTKKD